MIGKVYKNWYSKEKSSSRWFWKEFYKILNNVFYGNTLVNFRKRCKIEIIKKDDTDKIIKQQSKLTFNDIQKCYTIYDSYAFKQNEVLMEKPISLGFAILELSKLLMYETCYDKLQPYLGQDKIKLHHMDCDTFVLNTETQNIYIDLKNLEDIFDIGNVDEKHELFSNKNKKVIGKFKKETPKRIWIDEFIALRSKAYSFKCCDRNTDKLEGISNF